MKILSIFLLLGTVRAVTTADDTIRCEDLLPGQYLCLDLQIDPETQQPYGCTPDGQARIQCRSAPGIVCSSSDNPQYNESTTIFTHSIPCRWTNGYHFDTALLLSIFLGMFGADRFYLGYPAIGFLKFSTFGFFFLGHLLDVLLIASQIVGPADGSHYIIPYYGPGLNVLSLNSETARQPQSDWYT